MVQIAFVINVPMSFLEKKILRKIKEENKIGKKAARPISLLLTIILAAGVMVLVMFGVDSTAYTDHRGNY